MGIEYNLVRTRIHLDNLVHNYALLQKAGHNAVPVIKSDAYGHGLIQVAERLNPPTVAVGTVEEAVALRHSGYQGRIISLLGPTDMEECRAVWFSSILPLVYRMDQLRMLAQAGSKASAPLALALKFDTGMARLGFTPPDVDDLLAVLPRLSTLSATMLVSHLASADDPAGDEFTLEQAGRFEALAARLQPLAKDSSLELSLCNSAATLAFPQLHHDLQRVGIALYGANPFHGTDKEALGQDLKPAMDVHAPVLQVHPLKKGASISYGRTFTAPEDMRVAVVACGYADAYSRGMSSKGEMLLGGRRVPILGRVCMQMTAVDVSHVAEAAPGDRAYLLGGQGEAAIRPEELAAWWGTIPYEVFCLLGLNKREYV